MRKSWKRSINLSSVPLAKVPREDTRLVFLSGLVDIETGDPEKIEVTISGVKYKNERMAYLRLLEHALSNANIERTEE